MWGFSPPGRWVAAVPVLAVRIALGLAGHGTPRRRRADGGNVRMSKAVGG